MSVHAGKPGTAVCMQSCMLRNAFEVASGVYSHTWVVSVASSSVMALIGNH